MVLDGGFNPQAGEMFKALTWTGSRTGTFTFYNLPTLDPGLSWSYTYAWRAFTVGVVSQTPAVPEPETIVLAGVFPLALLYRLQSYTSTVNVDSVRSTGR